MRNTVLIALFVLLFSCSCSERKHDSSNILTDDFKRVETTVNFPGYWVSEDYYNSIRQFKSPRKAQEGSQSIFIPERTLQQTLMIYNFHEGGPFLKVLKRGDNFEIWEVQNDSLTQRQYFIEVISPSKIKIGDKTFIKINDLKVQDSAKVLEEILFSGKYTNSEGNTIEFNPNGELIGLGNYKIYSPVIDYFDAGMQIDQVGLGSNQKDLQPFGFKFNQDTLELYSINCLTFDSIHNSCIEVGYGELLYKLWRKE